MLVFAKDRQSVAGEDRVEWEGKRTYLELKMGLVVEEMENARGWDCVGFRVRSLT